MSSRNVQQNGPTPRRSARASTVARSIASQSIATATPGNSATPTKRKGALPKLNARQSTAYGASGRITVVEELNVPVTGFAQAFESQRGAAVQRANENLMSSGALSQEDDDDNHSVTRSQNDQDYESEDPPSDEESVEEEDESVTNTSKSFGMTRESGMLRTLTPPKNPRSAPAVRAPISRPSLLSPREPQSVRREPESIRREPQSIRREPESIRREPQPIRREPQPTRPEPRPAPSNVRPLAQPPIRAAPREQRQPEEKPFQYEFKKEWFQYLLYGILALFFALLLTKPGNLTAIRSGISGLIPSLGPSYPDTPKINDPSGEEMIDWVRRNDQQLSDRINVVQGTIQRMKEDLPDFVVVTKAKDGSLKIDDEFWNALVKKMKSQGLTGNTGEEWEAWMIKNKGKVRDVFDKVFDADKAHPHIIHRKEFTKMIEKNWLETSQLVDKKIAEVYKTMDTKIKNAVAKDARQAWVDQIRLQSLAMTNLVTNMELNLKKPNYFSSGLGAKIDTTLSSPTFHDEPAFSELAWRYIMPPAERLPPAVALEKWDEVGDCWCSAPSDSGHGRAQLAINLGSHIFPSQITIEHVPMTMVPAKNIANAPKNVELWVKSETPAIPRFSSYGNCKNEEMPEGWICLGSVKYDIFGANHIQTFDLSAESPVAIDQAIVRVTENWGADRTCIYRVRLHGAYEGPDHEYTYTE